MAFVMWHEESVHPQLFGHETHRRRIVQHCRAYIRALAGARPDASTRVRFVRLWPGGMIKIRAAVRGR
jgi:hypothetical protein